MFLFWSDLSLLVSMSFPLAATGGALVLLTVLGRNGWLRAFFLQAGRRIALTLGAVTVPTSDIQMIILGNAATV